MANPNIRYFFWRKHAGDKGGFSIAVRTESPWERAWQKPRGRRRREGHRPLAWFRTSCSASCFSRARAGCGGNALLHAFNSRPLPVRWRSTGADLLRAPSVGGEIQEEVVRVRRATDLDVDVHGFFKGLSFLMRGWGGLGLGIAGFADVFGNVRALAGVDDAQHEVFFRGCNSKSHVRHHGDDGVLAVVVPARDDGPADQRDKGQISRSFLFTELMNSKPVGSGHELFDDEPWVSAFAFHGWIDGWWVDVDVDSKGLVSGDLHGCQVLAPGWVACTSRRRR